MCNILNKILLYSSWPDLKWLDYVDYIDKIDFVYNVCYNYIEFNSESYWHSYSLIV